MNLNVLVPIAAMLALLFEEINAEPYYAGEKGEVCKHISEVIRSEAQCKNALQHLGYENLPSFWTGEYHEIPSGCSIRNEGDSQPHFETSTTGVGKGREDLIPICSKSKEISKTEYSPAVGTTETPISTTKGNRIPEYEELCEIADCTIPKAKTLCPNHCKIASRCVDSDKGSTDDGGDTCEYYKEDVDACGLYDDEDFTANNMCCACGGGMMVAAPEEPTTLSRCNRNFKDSLGRSCLDYIQNNLCFHDGFNTNDGIGLKIHCDGDCDYNYIIGDVGDDVYADYDLVKDFAVNGYDATSCPECGCREDEDACTGDEWQCFTGNECVWAYKHCDGVADCKDKSDEVGCGGSWIFE